MESARFRDGWPSMLPFDAASTAAVYGNPAAIPIGEDDPTCPMSPCGSSKLMTEIMLRDAGFAHGLDHVILRYFNVAGVIFRRRAFVP